VDENALSTRSAPNLVDNPLPRLGLHRVHSVLPEGAYSLDEMARVLASAPDRTRWRFLRALSCPAHRGRALLFVIAVHVGFDIALYYGLACRIA